MKHAGVSPTIPEHILGQAFHWAVVLGDSVVTAEDQQTFDSWLKEHTLHQAAWQRIQVIEQEVAGARPAAKQAAGTLKRLAGQQRRSRNTKLGAVLSLLLFIGLGVHFTPNSWHADYNTGNAPQHLMLDGGARLYINSHTVLDIEATENGPVLYLYQGQILVESAAAALGNKPQVITQDGRFTPIGTRFLVHKQRDDSELIVTEGKVKISANISTKIAIADDHWRVADGDITPQTQNGIVPDAWVDNVIEANNARLADVLDALSQHRRGWLRYDQATADLRITGVFRIDDTDSALAVLENSLPIHVKRLTGLWVNIEAEGN